jgi:hypothetical protein
MDKIKKIRICLISFGIFIQAIGFYLSIFSETKNVTYPNGITLPELFFPYTLEGAILNFTGPLIYWAAYRYNREIKGKKELLKKLFWSGGD